MRDRGFKFRPRNHGANKRGLAVRGHLRKIAAPYLQVVIQRSSVVERSAVNRLVVGSNPTAGAKLTVTATIFCHPERQSRIPLRNF